MDLSSPPPSGSTFFALLRHGTTLWNEEGRIQGQSDSALSPQGCHNCEVWSHFLAGFHWDRILASDLGRVRQTVSILNRDLSLSVFFDTRLREQHWGRWEGMLLKELREQESAWFRENLPAGWDFSPPDGETRRSVQCRVRDALAEAGRRWPGEKILVISHQVAIKSLIYHITARSFLADEKKLLDKDRLHTLLYTNGVFSIQLLNIAAE